MCSGDSNKLNRSEGQTWGWIKGSWQIQLTTINSAPLEFGKTVRIISAKLTILFKLNLVSQWSVSREIVRLQHSAELREWRIKHSQLYHLSKCDNLPRGQTEFPQILILMIQGCSVLLTVMYKICVNMTIIRKRNLLLIFIEIHTALLTYFQLLIWFADIAGGYELFSRNKESNILGRIKSGQASLVV